MKKKQCNGYTCDHSANCATTTAQTQAVGASLKGKQFYVNTFQNSLGYNSQLTYLLMMYDIR